MRSASALVITGAHLKSMSAMPMPATIVPISLLRSAWSHLTESLPSRLYGVSKSNLPFASTPISAPLAPASLVAPGPTAPTSAVIPALLRNDLRSSPACCAMCVLLGVSRHFQDKYDLERANPTPAHALAGIFWRYHARASPHERGPNDALHVAHACVRRHCPRDPAGPVGQHAAAKPGKTGH